MDSVKLGDHGIIAIPAGLPNMALGTGRVCDLGHSTVCKQHAELYAPGLIQDGEVNFCSQLHPSMFRHITEKTVSGILPGFLFSGSRTILRNLEVYYH